MGLIRGFDSDKKLKGLVKKACDNYTTKGAVTLAMGMSNVFVFRTFNHHSSLADTILGVRFFCSERREQGVEKYLKHKRVWPKLKY